MVLTANDYKCVSKYELSILCGVSCSTLQNWLNRRYYSELSKLGYSKRQKLLLPPVIKYLFERLMIIEDKT